MVNTVNLNELQQIINAEHGNPHNILGMHELNINGKECIVVRAFIPQAESIIVIDEDDKEKQYQMKKIHDDGFFEITIAERKSWFRYLLKVSGKDGNEWITYDPYSFKPVISDLDIYLFSQGNHYQIYEKLGAHPMNIKGVSGVLFAVWAPNAMRVSVIGDFNQWDGRRNPMRIIQNSGVWELFIPGIKNFDKYKFEIKSLNGNLIEKSDPYANFAELRPSTASLVYDITKYKWNDKQWYDKISSRDKLNIPMNIYEVHLGSWRKKENAKDEDGFLTYLELADELIKYVKEMGYTHIELLPVEEHPFDGSWGYQVTGYYAPTSRYGTPDEFMQFIDRCHQNDIGVILDWVPAHFPKDASGLAKFDGTALYEHEDPRQGEHPEWGTLIFNYGRNEVKNFLIANALFWVGKYHIDGLRVDAVASMLYLDYGKKDGEWIPNKYGGRENFEAIEFMKHMNSIMNKKYPHAYMIAEESTAWEGVTKSADDDGLGFTLKWNMGWMNDFLEYVEKDPVYKKYHHNNLTFGICYAYSENFILVLSHDEVVHGKKSMLDKMPGDLWQKFANLRVAYGFMFGHPGKKLLFMGGEFGQFIEWDEKRPLDWFLLGYDHHKQTLEFVRDLNHFYLDENALWDKDFSWEGFEWIDCNDNERSIISFIRRGKTQKDTLIFVCNFTPNVYEDFRIGVPFASCYKEIFNSDNPKYGGSGVVNTDLRYSEKIEYNGKEDSIGFRLPPLAFVIFKPE